MRRFIINCLDHTNAKEQNRWAEVTAVDSFQAKYILRDHDILKFYGTYELVSSDGPDKNVNHSELLNWGSGLACA